MKMALTLLGLILLVIGFCEPYKILVISPMPGKSHAILGDGVIKHLLKARHQVSYVTAFPESHSHPNLTIVDVKSNRDIIKDDMISLDMIMNKKVDLQNVQFIVNMFVEIGKQTIANKNFQNVLKDKNQEFDVIIAEWMFTEIYAGLMPVFDCPLIWLSTIEPHWMVLQLIDEIPNPAYTPDSHTVYAPPFTFWQRVELLLHSILGRYLQYRYVYGSEQKTYEQFIVPHIRDKIRLVPSLDILRYNASLMFGNSHYSLGRATRLPQNYIPIGGYHIDTDTKPLPKDLQIIMDNAKNGVIYFSMGSNLKSKHFPQELKEGLLKLFGELKQTVIWKFEEQLETRPKNVHIVQWAPQQSILAHPNCVLFITHGGLLSTTEAIHFGVPIIGIPVFADQFTNIEVAVNKGYARKTPLSYSMVDDLRESIRDVLNNPNYSAKAKELSRIYHSRVVHPSVDLVHWTEEVVVSQGALYLRSAALQTPLYQKLYLDLAALVIIIILALIYITRKVLRIFTKKAHNDKKKN
ncbi:UDP-glucosyltransferase 2-like isoform X6 [Pieris napi]|uniref:UDP-glucosyltransferase 2-like isoform X5 n=3 Tax=Pieris napi TaxID=78633 RepID=UPI001FB9BADD|nr:UDP-glucosyltransferase 2-like isoform X5 [Pieris napi]XP_047511765.1 UDP-glucosyltransferase 2-like isoform X6 [Pieris napi]